MTEHNTHRHPGERFKTFRRGLSFSYSGPRAANWPQAAESPPPLERRTGAVWPLDGAGLLAEAVSLGAN